MDENNSKGGKSVRFDDDKAPTEEQATNPFQTLDDIPTRDKDTEFATDEFI